MADLMTGTYSTENLRRDNGGFMIPDFSIEADWKTDPPVFKERDAFY